ncbi:phosphate ABC transporter permease subunit PstC [Streptantibioticus ferralitis]|uniref:Phosphate transport system permease protein n=1 Tax=Streptantibioticus ferralitis TaxID=236510 RepID=A0ABT5YU32_9ACTN|nr:phosphate ABC transporter permease subunit PstC [Streptantibioticus ferralitis]MDF2255059.1 phosphate ABC transporter permease subunit PstC [Streptantibioticus ferralitis]
MTPLADTPATRRRVRARWRDTDTVFRYAVRAAAALVVVVLVATAVFLVAQAWPALRHYGILSFLSSDRWAPSEATTTARHPNPYGIVQFVYGTAVTSLIAMVLAVPVAVAVSLYLTEVAPGWLRKPLSGLVDLLAAIPSVVYGFWGIFALIPAVRPAGVWLSRTLGSAPGIGPVFAGPFFGVSYLVAGLVLAIMILPIITAICREVFATVPTADKESALALGATRWEMLRMAVLPRSRSGITGAAVLGLGRAVGETIAVTMVIGNSVLSITKSILGPGATMSSVIANEFTESTEPFHLQSLMVVGAWLLVIALIVNTVGKLIVRRTGEDIA